MTPELSAELDAAWRGTYCAAPDWSVSSTTPAAFLPYDGRARLSVDRYTNEDGTQATPDTIAAAVLAGRRVAHPLDGTLWNDARDADAALYASGALVRFVVLGSWTAGTARSYTQRHGEDWSPLRDDAGAVVTV